MRAGRTWSGYYTCVIIGASSLKAIVIPAITLFLLYSAGAWLMLRSLRKPRLEPFAWVLILVAIVGHSDAIMHMMRSRGPFSIGLLEAMSLLTDDRDQEEYPGKGLQSRLAQTPQ